jgi:hypothetical protein
MNRESKKIGGQLAKTLEVVEQLIGDSFDQLVDLFKA